MYIAKYILESLILLIILFSFLYSGFLVDQEMAQPEYGISTDRHGNTSWLMSAKDFQSMLERNMYNINLLIHTNVSHPNFLMGFCHSACANQTGQHC